MTGERVPPVAVAQKHFVVFFLWMNDLTLQQYTGSFRNHKQSFLFAGR